MNSLPPDIFARHKRRKNEVNSERGTSKIFPNCKINSSNFLARSKRKSLLLHQTIEFVAKSTRDSLQMRV